VASDSLSQHDIDALLGGAARSDPAPTSPAASEPPPGTPTEAITYDFRRPHRISRDKRRALDAIYGQCASTLAGWLVNRVRSTVEIRLARVESMSFADLAASLPTPCASFTFEVKETGGQYGLIDVGHDFAFFLIDRLFGGTGTPAVPTRVMTPIERMAVRVVADRALSALQQVWAPHVSLELALAGYESIPEMLRLASREDPMLVATCETLASDVRSQLVVCMPFAPLDSFFALGQPSESRALGTPVEQAQNRELAERSLRGSRMWVSARLPEFHIAMRDLLGLTTGGVLSTGLPRSSPIDVMVNSQRRFTATPGRLGTSLAVRLHGGVLPAPEADAISIHRA
jgi:flagellar motor switch protein FliM